MTDIHRSTAAAAAAHALLLDGVALSNQGDRSGAIAAFRAALEKDETNHQAWRNLGAALKGLATPAERIDCYQRALALEDDPYTRANLAAALLDSGDFAGAVAEAKRATEALPRYLTAWINLGHAYAFFGDQAAAEAAYRKALEIEPDNADVLHGLGALLAAAERYESAAEVMARAEALRPDDHKIGAVAARARHQIADWRRFETDVRLLKDWVADGRVGLPPFNLLSLPGVTAAEQKANAARHAEAEFAPFFSVPPLHHGRGLRTTGRLRVGYLSADLRTHVMGRLMGPVLQHSDGRRHDVYVYDLWSGDNPIKPSLLPHVTAWRPVSNLSIQATARAIAEDGIDVLVDMSGYTGYGRTAVLACRPAAVQVTFLGYPGSLGDRRLADYIITDRITSPLDHAGDYAECLAWVPGSILPPLDLAARLEPADRKALGLPEAAVVLAAFHNGYKYNPRIFQVWMRILRAVPEAVLWMLARFAPMQDRLRAAAIAEGVDPDRLHFYAGGAYADYLSALSCADVFLDTHPYTAGGTARDALWCGLPMVTLLGQTFAGRMAGAACIADGVSECAVATLEEYEALAIRLCRDGGLRQGLADRLCRVRDAGAGRLKRFAVALDDLYAWMAARAEAGLAPIHLDSDATPPPLVAAGSGPGGAAGDVPSPIPSATRTSSVKTFLHVGCGPKTKTQTTPAFAGSDWAEIRLDIDSSVKPDLIGTMLDMGTVTSGSMDAVFSSHNIEHLYPHEVPLALAEFRRVLKPDGFVVITCPDLQSVCALIAEDKLVEPAYMAPAGPIAPLDILYGHRPALAAGNQYMAHRCGFTERVLVGTLQAAGFSQVLSMRRAAPLFDLWALALVAPLPEPEARALAAAHLPLGGGAG